MQLNTIYCQNCFDLMRQMPSDFIDLTVTSPPYDDMRTYNGYSFDFEPIARELYRVTKQGGVVVWVIADKTVNGNESGTSFRQALFFKQVGFKLHDTMIWHKPNPVPTQHTRYESSFEYMFVLSKGKPKTTNILREASKTGGAVRTKHRATTGAHKYNDEGSYVTKKDKIKHNVWDIPSNTIKTGHSAVFPESLAADHILSWSNEGELVFDPFMGSGTTATMAQLLGRTFIGAEISQQYVDDSNERLEVLAH